MLLTPLQIMSDGPLTWDLEEVVFGTSWLLAMQKSGYNNSVHPITLDFMKHPAEFFPIIFYSNDINMSFFAIKQKGKPKFFGKYKSEWRLYFTPIDVTRHKNIDKMPLNWAKSFDNLPGLATHVNHSIADISSELARRRPQ